MLGGNMKHFVALTLFILTASLTAQVEHAPTVAQCEADQRLWLSLVEDANPKLPDFNTMLDEIREMDACKRVNPGNVYLYMGTESEIAASLSNRYMHFLQRHGLWAKFLEEDTAGKR